MLQEYGKVVRQEFDGVSRQSQARRGLTSDSIKAALSLDNRKSERAIDMFSKNLKSGKDQSVLRGNVSIKKNLESPTQ